MSKVLVCLRRNILLIANLTSVTLGVTIGLLCRPLNPSSDVVTLISFPGEIFFRMLKMLILPLMVTSLVTGLANLNGKSAGKIGLITIGYYIFTTLVATLVGIVLAISIRPGHVINNDVITVKSVDDTPSQSARDVFLDLVRVLARTGILQYRTVPFFHSLAKKFLSVSTKSVSEVYDAERSFHLLSTGVDIPLHKVLKYQEVKLNIFPENIVQATFAMSGTVYEKLDKQTVLQNEHINGKNSSNNNTDVTAEAWAPTSVYRPGMNALGILSYFVIFGVILGRLGDKGKVVLQVFITLNDITIQMVWLVMWYSPVGIMFLIIGKVLSVEDLTSTAQQLAIYLTTIIAGASLHVLVLLPLLYLALTRKNPFRIVRGITQAIVTALAIASSSATLPITIQCCEENLKMNNAITRFVLPLGATINMDGTAIFYVVSAVYVAQMHAISLHFFEMILLSLCTVLTSVGAAGIPNAAIVTLMVILSSVGLPIESISILLAVDWFLGRVRTVVNITGDCLTAAMLDHFFPQPDVDVNVDVDVEIEPEMTLCISADDDHTTDIV